LNNNDNFPNNDTSLLSIINTGIFNTIENPENKVKISPNPFKLSFILELESTTNEDIMITIFGQSGKALWEEQRKLMPGLNSFNITPEGLASGFYSIRIKGKTILKAARIIKIK
jgi:hypothetical protein